MSKPWPEKILIASDLLSGEVLFMGHDGWIKNNNNAKISTNTEEDIQLNALGISAMAANKVVDAYLIDISRDAANIPQPLHYREKMRTKGPSNRLDLGKQAERSV